MSSSACLGRWKRNWTVTCARRLPLPSGCDRDRPNRPALQRETPMPRYLILAQSKVTASTFVAWLEMLGEKVPDEKDSRRIVWDRPAGRQGAVDTYETLVRR